MSKQVIIALSREYVSGGHEIAEQLAGSFGLRLYDKNILDDSAREKNIRVDYLEKYDEVPNRLFDSRRVGAYSNSLEEIVAELQFEYLKDKAESGESFVAVGRCAETVLREHEGLISIFVRGELPFRTERIMRDDNLSEQEALAKIRRIDKKRKQYHNRHSEGKWGDSRVYDVCIDSSRLGVRGTADILETYIRARLKMQ